MKKLVKNCKLVSAPFVILFVLILQSCGGTEGQSEKSSKVPENDNENRIRRIMTTKRPNNSGCSTCIPANCQIDNSCSDIACQDAVKNCHAITEHEFTSMIQMYVGGIIPLPQIITNHTIDSLLNDANCQNLLVTFNGNENDTFHNEDITPSLDNYKSFSNKLKNKSGASISVDKFNQKAQYSQALFKAIRRNYSGEMSEIHLYKAIGTESETTGGTCQTTYKFDIIFAIPDMSGNILYYGDASDLLP